MRYLKLYVLTFVVLSCTNNQKVHQPKPFTSENTPDTIQSLNRVQLIYGEDITTLKKYKVIAYFNGMCGVCVSQMIQWDSIIKDNDINTYANIRYVVYTEELDITKYYLEENQIDNPVYFDKDSSFINDNKIEASHVVFITDSKNKIIYRGDSFNSSIFFNVINSENLI